LWDSSLWDSSLWDSLLDLLPLDQSLLDISLLAYGIYSLASSSSDGVCTVHFVRHFNYWKLMSYWLMTRQFQRDFPAFSGEIFFPKLMGGLPYTAASFLTLSFAHNLKRWGDLILSFSNSALFLIFLLKVSILATQTHIVNFSNLCFFLKASRCDVPF